MPNRQTYTSNSGNYTGAAGVANARTRIASWQVVHARGIKVLPQPPGAKDLIIFIQSTVPAHIPTGLIEVMMEDSQHQKQVPVYVQDAAAVPTTLAAAFNQDTAITYQRGAIGSFGDYLSIYFTSATASVDANCTYAMPVIEL